MHSVNRDGRSIAHICVEYDKIVPLIYLRQKGFDMNCQDNEQMTPFHIALYMNRPCALKFMSNWIDIDFNK